MIVDEEPEKDLLCAAVYKILKIRTNNHDNYFFDSDELYPGSHLPFPIKQKTQSIYKL
jgi:hypothetical protein